jgi:hypothetical protein
MKEIIKGALCAALGVVAYKAIYAKGYNKGVDECARMAKLAVDVKETVENKEEES